MAIRRGQEKDIPKLLDLLTQVDMIHHNGRPDLFRAPSTKYTAEELTSLLQNDSRPVFVWADDTDAVWGYAFCIFQQRVDHPILTPILTLYIDDLCVDESKRGHRIGTQLYHHVTQFAKEAGCYNVTLNVWAFNQESIRFYEKCGMQPQKIGMETIL